MHKISVLFCVASLSSAVALAQDYTLDVTSPSLDTSVWTTNSYNIAGQTTSHQFTQGSGLTLANGEWLYLTNPLSAANNFITISGSFRLNDSNDLLTICLHSSANPATRDSGGNSIDGVTVVMHGVDASPTALVRFTNTPFPHETIAIADYNFLAGVNYGFQITDTGSDVALSVNGAQLFSASYSANPSFVDGGDNVVFRDREFYNGAHSLEITGLSVSASAIPEPSTYAALLGFITLASSVVLRRRKVT